MSDDAIRRGHEIHASVEKLRRMIDEGRLSTAAPPRRPPAEPTGQTYMGIPIVNVEGDVLAGHNEGDVFVIDRVAIRSFSLVEPKWEFPPDYRTRDRQLAIYQEYLGGALFGHSEPAWVALKRRSEEALHRAINGATFSRRWWRDLRDSIVLGFKADWTKTVHPERRVASARSVGMITGLTS